MLSFLYFIAKIAQKNKTSANMYPKKIKNIMISL